MSKSILNPEDRLPSRLVLVRRSDSSCFEDRTRVVTFLERTSSGSWRIGYRQTDGTTRFYYLSDRHLRLVPRTRILEGPFDFRGHRCLAAAVYADHMARLVLEDGRLLVMEPKELDEDLLRRHSYLLNFATALSHEGDSSRPYSLVGEALGQLRPILPTALGCYLSGRLPSPLTAPPSIVFPFSFNLSQMDAVQRSLTLPLSLIQGPPGTGKTQTILNIIANHLLMGHTLAVVSSNNTAVDNIRQRLDREGLGCLGALLGSRDRQEAFFRESARRNEEFLAERSTERSATARPADAISGLDRQVRAFFEAEREQMSLRARLRELRLEHGALLSQLQADGPLPPALSPLLEGRDWLRAQRLKDFYLRRGRLSGNLSFMDRLRILLGFRLGIPGHLHQLLCRQPQYLNLACLRRLIASLERRDRKLEKVLEHGRGTARRLQEASMALLRRHAAHMARQEGPAFTLEGYQKDYRRFMDRYGLVMSSTFSLCSCCPRDYVFDCVIIDEASQVTIPSAAACLAHARSAVIVGDGRQLQAIIPKGALAAESAGVEPCYDASRLSILDSAFRVFPQAGVGTLLREHYRSTPLLADFFSSRFYDSRLVVMRSDTPRMPPIRLVDVAPGRVDRVEGSLRSERQGQETLDEIDRLLSIGYRREDIAVIAPYRAQGAYLRHLTGDGVASDTVHRFQGQEKPVVILNTVRNDARGFVDEDSLVNVAVSRARDLLILVGPMDRILSSRDGNLAALAAYALRLDPSGRNLVRSSRQSVFDFLFTPHDGSLDRLQTRFKMRGSPAENAFDELLTRALEGDRRFRCWRFVREYYLLDLTGRYEDLTEEELRYLKNGARLDFCLFDSLLKAPVMAFEVDGASFHASEEQRRRDRLKDSVMRCLGIPLLRLSTRGEDVNMASLSAMLESVYLQRNPQTPILPGPGDHSGALTVLGRPA